MNDASRKEVYAQLKADEGCEYQVYLDHLGYPTFGVGHLITEDDPEHGQEVGERVSEERVFQAFDRDLEVAIGECQILYGKAWEGLPEEVQQVLVNMMFNMGRPRLSGFRKFNAAIIKNDWATAAIEGRDSRWHKQVTNRAERLMHRLEQI
jgi:lysozyme